MTFVESWPLRSGPKSDSNHVHTLEKIHLARKSYLVELLSQNLSHTSQQKYARGDYEVGMWFHKFGPIFHFLNAMALVGNLAPSYHQERYPRSVQRQLNRSNSLYDLAISMLDEILPFSCARLNGISGPLWSPRMMLQNIQHWDVCIPCNPPLAVWMSLLGSVFVVVFLI